MIDLLIIYVVVATLVIGLIAGLLARAIVPGKDSMGIFATLLLGIVGSVLGQVAARYIPGLGFTGSWVVLPVLGAVIVLLIYNRVAGKKSA
jgi:uncharacterized membrane protein YeaQ/YmgE (transglycosylase-associated protein family)